jgi:hypothetical protein
MAIPPRGDVRRPLHLAIRSCRLLGILLIVLSLCGSIGMMVGRRGGATGASVAWVQFGALLVYLVPGLVYLVCAIYLKQRKFWAVVVALVMASLHLLMGMAVMVALSVVVVMDKNMDVPARISAVVGLIVILAFGQLVYHLARSFEAIKHAPIEEQRGFEPLSVQPLPPAVQPPHQSNFNDRPK